MKRFIFGFLWGAFGTAFFHCALGWSAGPSVIIVILIAILFDILFDNRRQRIVVKDSSVGIVAGGDITINGKKSADKIKDIK